MRLLTEPAFYAADEAVVPLAAGAACWAYFVVGIGAAPEQKTRMNWLIVLIAVGVEDRRLPPAHPALRHRRRRLGLGARLRDDDRAQGDLRAAPLPRAHHPVAADGPPGVAVAGRATRAGRSPVTSEYGAEARIFRIALIAAFPLLVLATGFLAGEAAPHPVPHRRPAAPTAPGVGPEAFPLAPAARSRANAC